MRAWLGLLTCACLLAGCWSDSGKSTGSGSTTAAAAQALTKAVSFEGGQLLAGFVPSASDSELVLMPAPAGSISPGDSALLGFDIDNSNEASDPSDMMLLQFESTQQHFQVKLTASTSGGSDAGSTPADASAAADASAPADAGAAADASAPAADSGSPSKPGKHLRHVELSYKVAQDVCTNLCDTTFPLKVTQAVRLRSAKIGAHATSTLMLDCTSHGNHALCGGKTDTGGAGHVSSGTGCNSFAPTSMPNASSACASCLNSSCPEVASCYGPNWLQGDFSGGACSALFQCANACSCDDTTCQQNCATNNISGECSTCLSAAGNCSTSSCTQVCGGDGSSSSTAGSNGGGSAGTSSTAKLDAGTSSGTSGRSGGSGSGGGGTAGTGISVTPSKSCQMLAICCNSLPSGSATGCQSIVMANSDAECASLISSLMSSGYCGGAGTGGTQAPGFDASVAGAGG